MKKILFLCLLATAAYLPQGLAQKGKGEGRAKIEALKVAIFTQELELTTKEAEQFWPVYNNYEKEMRTIDKSIRNICKDLSEKSDDEIAANMERRFTLQEEKIKLERKYYETFKTIIPVQKIAKIPSVQHQFKKRLMQEMRKKS